MYPFLFFYDKMIVTKSGVLNKVKLKLKVEVYQQIENSNIANQIHRSTIGYGKLILKKNRPDSHR